MKANAVTRNNTRQKLGDILPLNTPLSIHIQTSNACNFRCNYCAQSLSIEQLKSMDIDRKLMTYQTFTKIADQIRDFPEQVKVLNLTGFGEPLINKELPEMICYAKK
ncbi:MAG: radical SAM protein, partial [Thermincolia bacterium]